MTDAHRPKARLAVAYLALLTLAALGADWIAPYDFREQLSGMGAQAPSAAHWLGTDSSMRDVWSRMLYGTRNTLGIALLAVAVALTLGTAIGATAALLGGFVDRMLSRLADAFLAIPRILLLLLVVASVESVGPYALALLLGSTGWMGTSRLVRSETLALLATDHLRSARALGVPASRLLRRHLLPALFPTLATAGTIAFASVIPLEAGLAFLGIGLPIPEPSWGNIIGEAGGLWLTRWWLVLFPTLAITSTVIAANTLRESFQTRLQHGIHAEGER
jgi:peptide/nickel transport system permease protein